MVLLTRRVRFSSGHRYWLSDLSADENKALFGPWASPYNHGHNYVLDVSVRGKIDPSHGMVVNIKRLDDLLQDRVVSVFDQRSMNDEVDHFKTHAPCLENVLLYLFDNLFDSKVECEIDGVPLEVVDLRLEEMPTLWANFSPKNQVMNLTRTFEFAASHRLNAPGLSHEDNVALFGKCNNLAGHGHNYLLEVTVEGQPDAQTGMLVDLGALDGLVDREVVHRYDHKNLSSDIPEFVERNATSEVVAAEIFSRLSHPIAKELGVVLSKVRLHETERNIFEVSAQ
jgi:6-pyruvoyltetrahydropterin/6-carboxytetrahydropterin synthase